ncbi:tripartite tricarboxylate transporter substrate-binding protein [Hahella aquimaris]|uniref:Bug family tripartite tricarboxylate transporter substrate binding protein n=1 Tax=Hahella sp. HNIBRBA332 TaxID=3015983 RepID=UPI00273B5277|nr:tripartite tricarboxylate transporter substrate-binding protein [Hahella sp. HNIBRBA332]WLQ11643.1 tripartite tricarboxylate transporter substrate-binding protein [Hahella sp. HNIBRBA332]
MTIRTPIKMLVAAALTVSATLTMAYEPKGKVECIAPADPGGGWDFTCRSVGNVMEELKLVPGSVQTINMAGAGGGVAFAHTVSKRKNDQNLVVAASTATTTRLAQGQYPGMNAEMVNWIGAIGADYGVIAVSKNSPYKSLSDLMAALKQDPRSVKFAGGSANGGWDHLKVLISAKAAGVTNLPKISYLSYNNGGEAMTQVVGGHVDAFTGDITEVQGFFESGDLRVLAVLSEDRLPGKFATIPTAREQGIESIAPNWRGFYIPGGAPADVKEYWTTAIDKIYSSEQWKSLMEKNGLMPFHKSGAEFNNFVKAQISDIQALSKEIGLIR